MNESCLISQKAGLGDIIYLQTLIKSLPYKKVYWPVTEAFLDSCQRHLNVDKITYLPEMETLPTVTHGLNFEFAHYIKPSPVKSIMYAKYELFGMNPADWIRDCSFDRFPSKEKELFDKLKIKKNYKLVNLNFGSVPENEHSGHRRRDLEEKFKDDASVVQIRPVDGFSLFDWSYIIENADEIHTVETSVVYLVELLQTTNKLFMYRKGSQEDFFKFYDNWDYITDIHHKKWDYEEI